MRVLSFMAAYKAGAVCVHNLPYDGFLYQKDIGHYLQ